MHACMRALAQAASWRRAHLVQAQQHRPPQLRRQGHLGRRTARPHGAARLRQPSFGQPQQQQPGGVFGALPTGQSAGGSPGPFGAPQQPAFGLPQQQPGAQGEQQAFAFGQQGSGQLGAGGTAAGGFTLGAGEQQQGGQAGALARRKFKAKRTVRR